MLDFTKGCNMTASEELEIVPKDEAINSNVQFGAQNFYKPLCVTGYLTPLQRKKLREKRNISEDSNCINTEEVKKTKNVKRKRENVSHVRNQSKERIKRAKTKDSQRIEFTVSKILHVQDTNSNKTNKFFKSSSSDRLAKANFSLPLVMKKNSFADFDKKTKRKVTYSKKLACKENTTSDSSSEVFESTENSDDLEINLNSSCVEKPILHIIRREDMVLNPPSAEETNGFEFDWPSDDELLKRQEKARLLLREKNDLKDLTNVNKEKDTETKKQTTEGDEIKLYPIFHAAMKRQQLNDSVKRNPKQLVKKVKDSKAGGEQMIIDAGQKEIGAKICATCNMIYSVGHEEDERLHLDYHNMYLINLKFLGWKEENVIGEYCDGRVILVRKTDKSFMLKKVEDVLQVANRDLGFSSSALPAASDLTFILFISKDKQVAGCIVAEPISKAFPVVLGDGQTAPKDPSGKAVWSIGNWYSSSKAVPAVCGVNRIWVAHNYRRQRIASRMIDCLRCHFIYGHVIGIRELAFTDPSPDGREFAASYTGTDFFLVYK